MNLIKGKIALPVAMNACKTRSVEDTTLFVASSPQIVLAD